jgi:hypothetical protein
MTNRRPIERRRRPSFTPEILRLFVKLESLPQDSIEFRTGSRELARMLDLISEWWSGQHVNDVSAGPHHPKMCCAFDDWHTCRGIRHELLTACSMTSTPREAERATQ